MVHYNAKGLNRAGCVAFETGESREEALSKAYARDGHSYMESFMVLADGKRGLRRWHHPADVKPIEEIPATTHNT